MQQPHRYEYDIQLGSAPDRVVNMVGHGKKVLELGSGPGTITKALTANECRVTALEIDNSAIELVRPYCQQVHYCDFNDPRWADTLTDVGRFETVVAADVFEHLYDPWSCTKLVHKFLNANGCVVVSLPHAGHSGIMACLLNSDFDYGSWGLLDSTHIRFFGLANIQQMFENAGFKIIEVEFVVTRPEDSELAHHWKRLPRETRQALSNSRFSNIYQVVLRAVPVDADGTALNIMSQVIPAATKKPALSRMKGNSIGQSFKNILSPRARRKLKQLLRRT